MYRDYFKSPIGILELEAEEQGITKIDFCEKLKSITPHPLLIEAKSQLTEYFNGNLQHFDLKIIIRGTNFQKSVWGKLLDIPFGQTCSYYDIAKRINNPKAVRAVGNANGKNPIAIIVPCHRVIGLDGRLTGYAGGLARKAWLLQHEAASSFKLS